jgi:hypothetical protein
MRDIQILYFPPIYKDFVKQVRLDNYYNLLHLTK